MLKYILVLVISLGFMSPAFAGGTCDPECDTTCTSCDYGYCVCNGAAEGFNSRDDCISTLIDENCSGYKGTMRAACNKTQQTFCDCVVDNGCLADGD